jgi:nitroreductase
MVRANVQIQIRSTDDQAVSVDLGPAPTIGSIRQDGDALCFQIPSAENVYLSSSGRSSFSQPPDSCPFTLPPDTNCLLCGSVEITADSGDVRLWLIEYGAGERLGHQVVTLKPGPLRVTWRTNGRCDAWCLALRFTGNGRIRLADLAIHARKPPEPPNVSPLPSARRQPTAAKLAMSFEPAKDTSPKARCSQRDGTAARTSPRLLTRKSIEAAIRSRADHHLNQTHLWVDCYRIRRLLAVPLPISGIHPLEMHVRTLQAYPWSVWMTWALEERINSLGWAAEWFHDDAARRMAIRDLSSLAAWPSYRQRPDLDLTMSHAARIMWTAVNYWPWIGSDLENKLRLAAGRIADDGINLCHRQFGEGCNQAEILQPSRITRVLHNTPLVGAMATALAATISDHPRAGQLQKQILCLIETLLEARKSGHSEGVTYDGYVLDFATCWLHTLPSEQRTSLLAHPQIHRILDEAYMLGAPGNAMQVAELGDVEPEQMPFHLSAQARLSVLQPSPTRTWFLQGCDPRWLRADALGVLRDIDNATDAKVPPVGALHAHCTIVLRSGWNSDDLAVAISASNSPMGHVHRDSGSLVIGHNERWLITDAGYQQYMKTSEREFTLGVSAHNAPVINGEAQTRKGCREICLANLGESALGTALDITASYSAGLNLTSVIRATWMHDRNLVVVADQVVGPDIHTIQYHWHGQAQAAWWIDGKWAQLHTPDATLWVSSPQVNLAGEDIRRLRGSRGQVTLTGSADVHAPVIWWVFFKGDAAPDVELREGGLSLRVNGDTFGFGKAADVGTVTVEPQAPGRIGEPTPDQAAVAAAPQASAAASVARGASPPTLDCHYRRELYRRTVAQELHELDRHQLGQLIRFRSHFLDKITRWDDDPRKRGEEHRGKVESALEEWRRRGYEFGPDKQWAEQVLRRYEEYRKNRVKMIVRPAHEPGPIDVFSVIKNRKSVRFWKRQIVEREKIEAIVQAALEAPSSCNKSAWLFFVYENDLDSIVEGDATGASMTTKAPVRIYVAVDESFYREIYAPALDAGLAMQNMILAAHALGLGSCLVYEPAMAEDGKLPEGLDIPPHIRIYCGVFLGYPDEDPIKPERVNVNEALTFVRTRQEPSS